MYSSEHGVGVSLTETTQIVVVVPLNHHVHRFWLVSCNRVIKGTLWIVRLDTFEPYVSRLGLQLQCCLLQCQMSCHSCIPSDPQSTQHTPDGRPSLSGGIGWHSHRDRDTVLAGCILEHQELNPSDSPSVTDRICARSQYAQ